ncbi:hypothetical protein B0I35DRAFT_172482 [Stachybotrys elegans]|uniref:LYR motif-containing protein Cup1-like N-terminal domain-containing protein n=1 Tax=Stachybotrys elegans TaxID=80388 RepID=A0A8K0T2J7_9HYPO|nr:hypothetical protein B0I35DRAFT_172482 [Stachybotrys elegans]
MPPPHEPIAKSLKTLWLYRHILREVSYLSPAVQKPIRHHISKRFRQNAEGDKHRKSHISRAWNTLRNLRAANAGDQRVMVSLISKAFGRKGFRRHELVAQFVKPEVPVNTKPIDGVISPVSATKSEASATEAPKGHAALEEIISAARREGNAKSRSQPLNEGPPKFFNNWDTPKIMALLRSQRRQVAAASDIIGSTNEIKTLEPDIYVPKTNIWGNPPAPNVVQTKRAKWWKQSVNKLLPPLDHGEWELLSELSAGANTEEDWAVPRRRPKAVPLVVREEMPQPWNWKLYASQPISTVEKENTMSQLRRNGHTEQGPYVANVRERELSARWYRRKYTETLFSTPKASEDPKTKKPTFSWGSRNPQIAPARKEQLDFFEAQS